MIQPTAATKIPATGHAIAATTGASGRGAGFAISLTAFLDTATEASDGTAADSIDPAVRHDDAAIGKNLPVASPLVADPAVAWRPEVVPILTNGPAKAADSGTPVVAIKSNSTAVPVLQAASVEATKPVATPNPGAAAKSVIGGLTLTLPAQAATLVVTSEQASPKAAAPARAWMAMRAPLFAPPTALPGKTAPARAAAIAQLPSETSPTSPAEAHAALQLAIPATQLAAASAPSTLAWTLPLPVMPAGAKPVTSPVTPIAPAPMATEISTVVPTTMSMLLASTSPSPASLAPTSTPLRAIRTVTATVQSDATETPAISATVEADVPEVRAVSGVPIPAAPKVPVPRIPLGAVSTQSPVVLTSAIPVTAPAGQAPTAPTAPSPNGALEAATITAALAAPVLLADAKTPLTLHLASQPAASPRTMASPSEPVASPSVMTTRLAQLAPAFQPLVVGATAPAAQVFAAAIRAAGQDDRGNDRPALDTGAAQLAGLAADTVRHAVTAAASSEGSSLDMRHEAWPNAMLDHIERLRDSADASDTRIRVVPDALGSIDVSVRKDGDAVHVRFSAEQAATRQLLQDAQPRLADYAEARGLRLAGTGVDAGAGQNAQSGTQRQPVPQPGTPTAPVSATEDADAADSTRIA